MPAAMAPPAGKKTSWGKPLVEKVIKSLDFASSKPPDEASRRRVIRRFALLDQALRRGQVHPDVEDRARRFVRENLARFYAWLLRGSPKAAWSLAEVEGSPFLNGAEQRQWARMKDPVRRANFVLSVMQRRAEALLAMTQNRSQLGLGAFHAQKTSGRA